MNKILVIEDEKHVRENILDLLEIENFEVIAAENGRIGLQLAQEQIPDLILCDVMMPELDGYDVLKSLRQNMVTAKIPLIFLTARATKADFRQGMELGADDYLTKPFTREELLGAIVTRLTKQATLTQSYTLALQCAAEKLHDYLYYDSVTRLPTQLLLQEKFNQICAADKQCQPMNDAARHTIPILSLKLDRFNRFSNLETLNRDSLIQAIAHRLSTSVSDQDLIAQLSSDHFVIILITVELETVEQICQTILDSLSQPFHLDDHEVFVTASLGVVLYPRDGRELDDLMKKSNTAMHYVQEQGGNHYQFYREEMLGGSPARLSLESSLRRALERDEFRVFYQPQVNLQTGEVVGAEALVRWQNPERGMISPADFIPLAEETGLIRSIGEWVLHTACQQTQTWRLAGFSSLQIAVNLSGRQFNQPHLGQKIAQTLASTGLDPTALELELTESTLLQNASAAIAMLAELKTLGVQVAIDDFGTGYASLSYLQQFPFDTLKIDQCFVHNVTTDSRNAAITTAVLQLSRSLSLRVVAEGVETESELAFLRRYRCDVIQGYLFSRPVSAEDFEALLRAGQCLQFN
jgi:diguanylate cyclase